MSNELTTEQTKEIEKAVDAELLDEEPFDDMKGRIYQFDDGSEWLIFEDYETAERQAVDYVKEMLEDEPELFTQDWLENYITMSETDKKIFAGDEATNYAYDTLNDNEVMEEAGLDERRDELQDEIDELEEILNELKEELEELPDMARVQVENYMYDEIYNNLDDPVQYFVHDLGIYSIEDLMKASFITIDVDEAAQDAVDDDSVEHFFAGYDGEVTELDDGIVMYRTN